jgi:antitoxin component YwqK of YwqJK toxin-antitoxin module
MESQEKSLLPQVIRTYYETEELREEYFQLNGNKEGEYKSYHKNCNLWIICNYVDDKRNGERKSYYDNGNLYEIYNYVNDKYNGEYKRYYENGNIFLICNYVDGKKMENLNIMMKMVYYG